MFLPRSTLLVAVVCASCGRAPTGPSPVDTGIWGGDHVTLSVGNGASHLEFDCAHGDIPGALNASHGEIQAIGTFVREHGGPIRIDEPLDSHPAFYSGTVSTDTMKLSIRLTDSGDVIGSFTLARGVPGRVLKCL